MICARCQTTLPEEAIACWKCGTLVVPSAPPSPVARRPVDLLLVLITLLISVAVFVCLGWAVPFTVWGLITSSAKQYPEWSGLFGIISGGAFVLSALAFFGGTWWGCYKLLERLTSPTSFSQTVAGAPRAQQAGDQEAPHALVPSRSPVPGVSRRPSEPARDAGEDKSELGGGALDSNKISL